VIGYYHPHGDTSVYDAMVRLSQDWKMGSPLVNMQGNNGSIDGDSPAAYRYTEARLTKIAGELLKDIEKNTVKMAPNFADTLLEPTVLPAKFPNLLVNGTTGISAGYATNIPPHNLIEVIDATIALINNPECTIEELLSIIKGPDFPTGGIVLDLDGITNAFTTGRGKITVRSKVENIKEKGKVSLIVSEIPYDVLKTNIVKKIDEIRLERKIEGILEVRDESDKEGLRIAIDLKKESNAEVILNYLYKNTDLQVSYNYNMIAIVNRRPKLLSLKGILDSYIAHLKEVIKNRTYFDLAHAKSRFHIVEGLIKAISILDEVIRVIRQSKNKSNAKENLVKEFSFTEAQAEAIVVLQLYRLTNTDITLLENEQKELQNLIAHLEAILQEEIKLKEVMKEELTKVKEEYGTPRKTMISYENAEIKIDQEMMIPKEEVIVLVTKDGYVKRTSKRSYFTSKEEPLLKEGDYIIGLYEQSTLDTLLLFTNLGNYIYLPVYDIPDIKWRQLGKHISNIVRISEEEQIISAIPVENFQAQKEIIIASKQGMIKKTNLEEFKVSRYSKPMCCMKLKEKDQVVSVNLKKFDDYMLMTNTGYSLWIDTKEIPLSGCKSSGVKSMVLKGDFIVKGTDFDKENSEYITVFTDHQTAKRMKITEFEKQTRARRGSIVLKDVKSNPYHIVTFFIGNTKSIFGIKKETNDIIEMKNTEISISDRLKTGSTISKEKIQTVFDIKELEEKKSEEENIENDKIDKVDDKQSKEKEKPISISNEPENIFAKIRRETTQEETPKIHQISLLEIDEELRKIDDMLKEEK